MKALLSVCVCVFFFHTLCKLSFGSTVCYGPSDLRPLALSSSSLTHDVAFYKGARARGGPCLRQMVLEGYMLFFFFVFFMDILVIHQNFFLLSIDSTVF